MRCIEMIIEGIRSGVESGLIETWDVLKFLQIPFLFFVPDRLIETWDVLKLVFIFLSLFALSRLIETWDVLKFELLSEPLEVGKD